MGISKEWGKELQAQHFKREMFPMQGFCLSFAIKETDENGDDRYTPQKSQTFYIAEPKTKDNHVYTLSCIETALRDHCTDPEFAETFKRAETLYFISDGSEKQNWSRNVFHGIDDIIKDLQNPGDSQLATLLPNVNKIEILKTVTGHGKNSLDAAFGTIKQTIRKDIQTSGAMSANTDNPSGGFENAMDIIYALAPHRLFNAQYESRPDKPIDKRGYQLMRRKTCHFNSIVVENKYGKSEKASKP